MTWRDRFRPMIAEVIGCFSPGDDIRYIRKAVLASWPSDQLFERRYWPYKVWLSEIRHQLAARAGRERPTYRVRRTDPQQQDFWP